MVSLDRNKRTSDASDFKRAEMDILKLIFQQMTEIQVRNPNFSIRAMARRLQISQAALSEVLKGKRKITLKMASRILNNLAVDPHTKQKLLTALPAKQTRTRLKEKIRAKEIPFQFVQLSTDEFRVVADWYYFALLSLAETKGFKSDPLWMADRLSITEAEANRAVQCLIRLNLMKRNSDGKLIVTGKKFTTTQDISDSFIRKNHAQGLGLATDSLHSDPVELREFAASTIAIDPSRLEEAKIMLRNMRRQIADFLEGGEKKEVYRLSVQLFPLTHQRKVQV